MQYRNPAIRGFNPDPSFCRVGEDFYMVTSSFEFFPGVPIYHSRNLVDWELISHCLTDETQLPLDGARASGGIYAPTIRHHEGRFYMTTTNVTNKGNFIVHSGDIRGKWSPPVWINQGGIDPSMLFEDGTCYYCSNGSDEEGACIQLSEVNPLTGAFIREPQVISRGSGGRNVEAPHLYKIKGWYYLMLAEGGTEFGHMETMFRAKSPYGPYEPCRRNPILSHRDYAKSPIQCTGHADLLEDQNGNFWLCFLATRPLKGNLLHNIGRESFLAPVKWGDDGFPVIGNDGTAELLMEGPLPAKPLMLDDDFADDFSGEGLSPHYNFYRNPEMARYVHKRGEGLLIDGTDAILSEEKHSPAFIGIRQKEVDAIAETGVCVENKDGAKAGITAFYNWSYHYDLYAEVEGGQRYVCLRKRVHDMETVTDKVLLPGNGEVRLKIGAGNDFYCFYYMDADGRWQELGTARTAGLCTEQTFMMTFTGTYLGLFAEGGKGSFSHFTAKFLKD